MIYFISDLSKIKKYNFVDFRHEIHYTPLCDILLLSMKEYPMNLNKY